MPVKKSKLFGILLTLMLIFVLVVGGVSYRFISTPITPAHQKIVKIDEGTPFGRIAKQLEKSGIVSNARYFVWLAHWQNATAKVQAGEYLFTQPATPGEVMQRLVVGDVYKILVTFPEGLNLYETAERVAAAGICTREEFLELTTNPELAKEKGIPAKTLEGYLFPETYTLQSKTTPIQLIDAMISQFNAVVTPEMIATAKSKNLDRHQLVTLASIIQKEAGNNEEMPLISAVFHNRLNRGIALQADPTVIYGIENFDGNLTRKHLETPTPYNTYQKRGLPHGPIANPGREALQAAAVPADVRYLYFVARGDGTHEFSLTLKEHNRAVRRYQIRR